MSDLSLHVPSSATAASGPAVSSRLLAEFIGVGTAAEQVRRQIAEAASDEGPVWIIGEPGTGTALVARLIHAAGPRAFRPFIKLDCRVLSSELLRRELFGDGGNEDAPAGWLRDWRGCTLFLDHLDEMPVPVQKELAAALDLLDRDTPSLPSQRARMIAAGHADLTERIVAGTFHRDLFAHFESRPIVVAPLRERTSDLPLLIEHFVTEIAVREGRPPRRIAADTIPLLEKHGWPNNVRELRSVIERVCAVDASPRLSAASLAPWIAADECGSESADGLSLREMERHLIETTFARYGGNRERTAQALKIGLRTLSGKLREYGYPPRGGPGSNRNSEAARAA